MIQFIPATEPRLTWQLQWPGTSLDLSSIQADMKFPSRKLSLWAMKCLLSLLQIQMGYLETLLIYNDKVVKFVYMHFKQRIFILISLCFWNLGSSHFLTSWICQWPGLLLPQSRDRKNYFKTVVKWNCTKPVHSKRLVWCGNDMNAKCVTLCIDYTISSFTKMKIEALFLVACKFMNSQNILT